jgi:Mn2+/Fe2+ NRAMP family transporter
VAKKFYSVLAVAVLLGLLLNFLKLNAVKMLFYSAVINGVLAPPLIVLVTMLTSDQKVMGKRINPTWLKIVGWATAGVMAGASVAMIFV